MEYLDKEGIKTLWSKVTGKLGDYLPLSGGTMKDNSTITAKNLTLSQGVNEYLYLGNTAGFTILKGSILGDNDILPKWTIDGDTMTAKWFNGCASSTGVNSLKVYAENSNQINFGGTGTDTTIVFGNTSKDDRAVPTTYKFGADGTAKILGGITSFYGNYGKSNCDANVYTDGILYNYGNIANWKNAPQGMSYGSILTFKNSFGNDLSGQLAWDINHSSTTDTTRYLWWRATDQGDWVEAKWHQIAFTNSNVASATKLANNRTLWGQTFNGEQNVLGNLQLSDSAQNQNNIGLIYSAEFGNASGFIGFEGGGLGVILGWGEYKAIQDNVNISPISNNTFSVNNSGIKYKGVDVYHANNISTAQTATQTVNGLMSADDKKKLDNLPNISSSQSGESILDYMLAYGVEWTLGQDNPEITRIGNMQLHKTLPIQSNMKGCIVQNGNKVMYYLGENSWKERAVPVEVNCSFTISKSDIRNITIEFPTSIEEDFISKQSTIDLWWLRTGVTSGYNTFLGLRDSQQTDTVIYGKVFAINSRGDGLTPTSIMLRFDEDYDVSNFSTNKIYIGSNLSGYDGEVKVEVPEFGIKSYIIGDKARVFIAPTYIDGSYTIQKKAYVSTSRVTVLNTVPGNAGYLSTLPKNSAVSIVNNEGYCRGGNNRESYDSFIDSDIFRSDLGKPRTNLDRATMRSYARLSNNEILNYIQYKNIFYWLYVIEYANFNSQAGYTSALTTEGYHKGGMGQGVTNVYNVLYYNNRYPITPCGYTMSLGNKSGIKALVVPQFSYTGTDNSTSIQEAQTIYVPRWRGLENIFGDTFNVLDGIIIYSPTNYNIGVYITNNPSSYSDDIESINKMILAGYIASSSGYIKDFYLGKEAHILPSILERNTDKGKCDYYQSNSSFIGNPVTIRVGGHSNTGYNAGISQINIDTPLLGKWQYGGFFTIKEID